MTSVRATGRARVVVAAVATVASLAGCDVATTAVGAPVPSSAAPSTSPARSVAPATAAEVAATRALLAGAPVGGRGPKTGYVRTTVFGPAWADVDRNGCGTRDDVLARDLTDVTRRSRCVVVGGTLVDPYTGRTITFSKAHAAAVQIDHVVPLALAWQLGAAQWPQGERVVFANDPANLLAVDGPANEAKSDSGPDGWLPPNKAYRCTYVARFTRVVALYRLRVTRSMRDAISAQLDRCTSVVGDPAHLDALPRTLWAHAAALHS